MLIQKLDEMCEQAFEIGKGKGKGSHGTGYDVGKGKGSHGTGYDEGKGKGMDNDSRTKNWTKTDALVLALLGSIIENDTDRTEKLASLLFSCVKILAQLA